MADFRTSTHRAKWLFTPQILAEKYRAANQRAIQTLEKYGSTRMEVSVDGVLLYRESQANPNAEKHSRSKTLNVEEEQFLRIFYERSLRSLLFSTQNSGDNSYIFQKVLLEVARWVLAVAEVHGSGDTEEEKEQRRLKGKSHFVFFLLF